jgi:hypothetical protein
MAEMDEELEELDFGPAKLPEDVSLFHRYALNLTKKSRRMCLATESPDCGKRLNRFALRDVVLHKKGAAGIYTLRRVVTTAKNIYFCQVSV